MRSRADKESAVRDDAFLLFGPVIVYHTHPRLIRKALIQLAQNFPVIAALPDDMRDQSHVHIGFAQNVFDQFFHAADRRCFILRIVLRHRTEVDADRVAAGKVLRQRRLIRGQRKSRIRAAGKLLRRNTRFLQCSIGNALSGDNLRVPVHILQNPGVFQKLRLNRTAKQHSLRSLPVQHAVREHQVFHHRRITVIVSSS